MDDGQGRQPGDGQEAGNRADLGGLWCTHRRWVAAVLLAHKSRQAGLDDLLQDVALAFVKRVHEVRDGRSLRPWLRSVAINAAKSAARRGQVRARSAEPLDACLPDPAAPGAEDRAELRERLRRVLEAAGRLPVRYSEPLLLKALDGLSQREIAETLGLSEPAVETRLARARRMLRERLAASRDEERGSLPAGPTFARGHRNGARP